MDKAIEALERQFRKVRTGRANPAMLDGICVEYYGTKTPLSQVSNIAVPDPQMIVITPWEKKILKEIERELLKTDLGITPQNDGNIIRLPIPPLTEERRKEMVKKIKKMGEDAKVSVRNVRREANDILKKGKEIAQDESKHLMGEVQKSTDDHIKSIDASVAAKEKELLKV